jgi:phosphatidylserine/phosphatidylglycerophosphate/cardiolipin synthase-like enzyme
MRKKKSCRKSKNLNIFLKRITFIFLLFPVLIIFPLLTNTEEKWYNVYFTSPGITNNPNNPEINFIQKIRNTKKSIYGAFFEITSMPIITELINAKKRGIDIKLVLERDNFFNTETQKLVKADIEIVTDDRNGFMHNKFAIFDKTSIWTGSYNLTYNCGFRNNNNAVFIESIELAAIYFSEFDEMFNGKIFGNKKELSVFQFLRHDNVYVDGNQINIYFSPEDSIEDIIVEKLKNAKLSVYFMIFSFTSEKIRDQLIKLHKNGVKVCGIFEKTGSNSKYSEYKILKLEGIKVYLDKNKYRMHHKVIVIDGNDVITGSYNFSNNANKINDENLIIIQNKRISDLYVDEFNKLTGPEKGFIKK